MCEQEQVESEEESEEEENVDNTAETDNPEYYNKLMVRVFLDTYCTVNFH